MLVLYSFNKKKKHLLIKEKNYKDGQEVHQNQSYNHLTKKILLNLNLLHIKINHLKELSLIHFEKHSQRETKSLILPKVNPLPPPYHSYPTLSI